MNRHVVLTGSGRSLVMLALGALCVTAHCAATARAAAPAYDEAPISYSTSEPTDAVAELIAAIGKGERRLERTSERGYLDALLGALKVPASSQMLVFSKTSFQHRIISPQRPRAIYFNDSIYVGYVPGGDVIEIASIDPRLGAVFYTIDQSPDSDGPAEPAEKLVREMDNCLQCHGESMTRGIPGLLVRSVFADDAGVPILSAGTFLTTHESPLAERWGGWYVTGSTAGQPHMGNTRWQDQPGDAPHPIHRAEADLADVGKQIDATLYPNPHSDVVALMVLEHQVEAHNRIIRAGHGALRALRDEKVMNDAFGETPEPGVHSDSTVSRIRSSCEPLVEYLLFKGEAPLMGAIQGSGEFATEFASRGARDGKGRSLRDLDLQRRLFRYPCSYLVDSPAVAALPEPAREFVYRRLWEILSGRDNGKAYAHLSGADRQAIMEILRETVPGIAVAWTALETPAAKSSGKPVTEEPRGE
jgi:hypothetical protein